LQQLGEDSSAPKADEDRASPRAGWQATRERKFGHQPRLRSFFDLRTRQANIGARSKKRRKWSA